MLRIAHSADWHWEADKMDKCQPSADFIVGKLQELKLDLHVIAGDYWNRRQTLTKLSAVIPALETMRQLADISPVVLIYGNEAHDAPGSYEIFRNLNTQYPIHVAEKAETIGLMRNVGGASFFAPASDPGMASEFEAIIHLFPYPTKQWFLAGKENLSIDESNQLIQEGLRQIFTGFGAISMEAHCPVIFVGHCNVSGAMLSTGQTLLGQDIMVSKHDLELARADYYALGHIHKAQEVGPRMHYSGSVYHNNFGEVEKKGFNLAAWEDVVGRGSCQTTKIQIPSRPLVLLEAEIIHPIENDFGTALSITDGDPNAVEDAEVRIRIHGSKEEQLQWTDEETRETFPGAFSYQIERIITPTERTRSAEITKAKTLTEKVVEWGVVTNQEIKPDVLTLAAEVERSVTL